jgi:hypothetical protein
MASFAAVRDDKGQQGNRRHNDGDEWAGWLDNQLMAAVARRLREMQRRRDRRAAGGGGRATTATKRGGQRLMTRQSTSMGGTTMATGGTRRQRAARQQQGAAGRQNAQRLRRAAWWQQRAAGQQAAQQLRRAGRMTRQSTDGGGGRAGTTGQWWGYVGGASVAMTAWPWWVGHPGGCGNMVYRNTYHIIWYNITILWYGNISILYCTQLTINLQYLLSACGGFLSSRKSVARGALQFFCPNAPSPPNKKMPPRRSPYRLVILKDWVTSYISRPSGPNTAL